MEVKKKDLINISELIKNIIAPGDRAFYSPKFDDIINEILDQTFPDGWRKDTTFIKSIQSEFRERNFSTYDKEYFSAFYAAYYVPNNFYKIQLMLLELLKKNKLNLKETIKILDIGAAVGTTAWAVYDFFEILNNIYTLYGFEFSKQFIIKIDSIELSKNNIIFFENIRKRLNLDKSNFITVNKPVKADVLKDGLEKLNIEEYDIIFASNVICEFPNYLEQKKFANTIISKQKKDSVFIIIETAYLKDTKLLKKLQYDVLTNNEVILLAPCGKLKGFTERCQDCWSFRKENLIIPNTMKLFSQKEIEQDENEKLKWSYSIFSKSTPSKSIDIPDSNVKLSEAEQFLNKPISIYLEIVSMKIKFKNDSDYYYYHICDQSEKKENTLLKVPKYFNLPSHNFGDILHISNAIIEKLSNRFSYDYAISLNPHKTTVTNWSNSNEMKSLVKFNNITKGNLEYFLFRFFRFKNFKDGQFKILKNILRNQNILGILATGGGKSLIFQLAAFLKPGISIVISPLKSLMDDQITALKNRFGFDFADRIHSGMKLSEKKFVISRFRNGYLKMLYIAPERLQQKSFQKEISRIVKNGTLINYFTIDEAHCISEWGHDFRHSYARLKERQSEIESQPSITSLTATASHLVRKDILNLLKMNDKSDLIWQINDRQELSLEVIPLKYSTSDECYSITYRKADSFFTKKFEKDQNRPNILLYILEHILKLRFDSFNLNKDSGQIFTIYADPKPAKLLDTDISKLDGLKKIRHIESQNREYEGARWLSDFLRSKGYNCKAWYSTPGYRDNLTAAEKKKRRIEWEEEKTEVQNQFVNNRFNLLVSTKGFGMGIDKPNIRYVIHYGFPGSLESYFQQIGRAGRDGRHSHCILMWDSPTDGCKKSISKNIIPACYKKQSSDSSKYMFEHCKYGRNFKCDYAKQVFFIESSYPEKSELASATNYLLMKSEDQESFPYVYLKKDYLSDAIATNRFNKTNLESSLLENLYTLKLIDEFNQGYLAVKVKILISFEEIYNSTNDEDIKSFIDLMEIYKPGSKKTTPINKFIKFELDSIVQKLRESGIEIMIEELLNSLSILEDRNDIELKFNYNQDYGYEIQLNKSLKKRSKFNNNDFKSVYEWKKNQYQMLQTMLKFVELKGSKNNPDTKQEQQLCRRAFMMNEFGNVAYKTSESCDFCDVCGYKNDWDKGANDITADVYQTSFREKVRDFYANQTKDENYLVAHFDSYNLLIEEMISNEYSNMIEIISTTWLEQSNESNNPATNLTLAFVHYLNKDFDSLEFRMKIVIKKMDKNYQFIQRLAHFLIEKLNIVILDFYNKYLKNNDIKHMFELLAIFNHKEDSYFIVIERDIMINIFKLQIKEYSRIMKKY